MDTIGTRLRQAMTEKGLGVDDLVARKVLSRAGVYQWLGDTVKRDKVRDETVKKLCRALDIRREWLLDGSLPMRPTTSTEIAANDPEGWPQIRATVQGVSLGGGTSPDEYAETHKLKFREASLRRKGLRPHNLEVYYGRGDSMEPRIRDGDAILVDTSDTRVVDDRIYFIQHEGEYFVKRLQKHGDLTLIVSDNRDDPQWRKPRIVQEGERFEVLGRVRWIGSWEG